MTKNNEPHTAPTKNWRFSLCHEVKEYRSLTCCNKDDTILYNCETKCRLGFSGTLTKPLCAAKDVNRLW